MKNYKEEIQEFCNLIGITKDQFYGREEINRTLRLDHLTSIPKGFNPVVKDSLDLSRLTSIYEGFNPIVGASLNLNSLTSIPKGFNPIVGGSLYLNSLTSIPKGFNPTVGWNLDLRSLTSIYEEFNPIVGGSLDLSSLTSIYEGFDPTVGGNLYLNRLVSICEGFNPIVEGDIYLNSLPFKDRKKLKISKLDPNYVFTWQNGKYIKADGLFMEVVSKKQNLYKVKKIGEKTEIFLITDGNGKWSHGETLKEAKEDLIYKISNRDKTEYENLTIDSELAFEKGIEAYRVITGACSFGTRDFVENRLENKKESYKISEIIELTESEYGGDEFSSFFEIIKN